MLTESESRRYELFKQGLTYQEIADRESTSRTAIFNTIKKAKDKLGLNEPINLLQSEIQTLYKVARNQHELIINLSNQMDIMMEMLTVKDTTEPINKLTNAVIMMNRELMKLNAK